MFQGTFKWFRGRQYYFLTLEHGLKDKFFLLHSWTIGYYAKFGRNATFQGVVGKIDMAPTMTHLVTFGKETNSALQTQTIILK